MQIHELNKRPKKLDEVDLFGPTSVFNVGKQLNLKSIGNSSALGAAKGAAAQASAAASAQELAKQGYKVGGSIKPTVTATQQLQAVRTNTAVQQQIKNLTSQWMAQSAALKQTKPVTEAMVQFDPKDLKDPKYSSVLQKIQQQEDDLGKKLTVFKTQFKTWSDPRLQAGGITVDEVRKTPETEQMLDSALSNVAVAMQSGNENLEKQAVEEYFNIAIAAIQAHNQNAGSAQASSAPVAPGRSTASDSGNEEQQILQQLERVGISKSTLGSLGNLMTQSAQGSDAINNTGNPLLNAIAKLAGMKIR